MNSSQVHNNHYQFAASQLDEASAYQFIQSQENHNCNFFLLSKYHYTQKTPIKSDLQIHHCENINHELRCGLEQIGC